MRAALKKITGVTNVECDVESREVEVTFKAAKVTIEKLLTTFEKAGFPAKLIRLGTG